MKTTQLDTLQQINSLAEPRHLFVMPASIEPAALDGLIQEGLVTCEHTQRDEKGAIQLAMGLRLTPEGERLLIPVSHWRQVLVRSSLAGASFVLMSVAILYIG